MLSYKWEIGAVYSNQCSLVGTQVP